MTEQRKRRWRHPRRRPRLETAAEFEARLEADRAKTRGEVPVGSAQDILRRMEDNLARHAKRHRDT